MLLIGGRQRLNSLGGQHTNMKITFGLWLDGCPNVAGGACGEKVGPAGLLHWLEARRIDASLADGERERGRTGTGQAGECGPSADPGSCSTGGSRNETKAVLQTTNQMRGAVFLAAARSQASNPKPGMTHPPRTLGGTLSSSRVDKSDCPPRQPRQPHPARRSDTCFWHPFKK